MLAKAGGERTVLYDHALSDLVADATAVYFTTEDDAVVRIDGLH
jgi:hypothetical protein